MRNSFARVAVVVGLILLIPLFGNIYVDGWNWDPLDFVVMGVLLFAAGLAIDFAARKVVDPTRRTLVIIGIVLAFLALWAELAVGALEQLITHIL